MTSFEIRTLATSRRRHENLKRLGSRGKRKKAYDNNSLRNYRLCLRVFKINIDIESANSSQLVDSDDTISRKTSFERNYFTCYYVLVY